ncbi:MAG TPA: cytochrome c, partial [Urbifossiella sp.]
MNEPSATLAPKRSRFAIITIAVLAAAIGGGWAIGKFRASRVEAQSSDRSLLEPGSNRRGEILFQLHCASCHGPEGRGDGASAAALRPPPRDFAARPWRFDVPKESIRRVVLEGLAGTPMASFKSALTASDIDAVTEYAYFLATSRMPFLFEPSQEEKLLKEAGFTDLRGAEVPPLTISEFSGKELKLADLKGKFVVLHF